ncbi:MAG TPA: carbon-nitrogen hydrolase family protein [Baekduia sp.]|nr:carbon-nitrogen hydrolase family protein [Baekduia sp.]
MRAAAIQMTTTADREHNLATAERLVRAAAADRAELVVLPEKWPAYGPGDVAVKSAEPLNGPALRLARGLAAELGIDLIAGSIPELGSPRGSNTSVHIGPDGRDRAVYRKLHMFDVVVGDTTYAESAHEAAGDEIVTSETDDGTRLGMTICYDLRFAELFAALRLRGARVIVVPSAFTVSTTRDHWEVLLRARAIENQCFVIAPNQTGEHAAGLRSGGRSLIVDPWGTVLADAGTDEGFIAADLDFAKLERVRQKLPSFASRRGEIYG